MRTAIYINILYQSISRSVFFSIISLSLYSAAASKFNSAAAFFIFFIVFLLNPLAKFPLLFNLLQPRQ